MNIMYLLDSISPYRGGIARVSRSLADYFEHNGISVYYAFFGLDDDSVVKERKHKFDEFQDYFVWASDLEDFILSEKIDIIIHQDQNDRRYINFYKNLKQKDPRIKVINCMHNLPNFYKYWNLGCKHKTKSMINRLTHGYDIDAWPYHFLYEIVDAFVLLSESFKPLAQKCYGLGDCKKLFSISNPLPFELGKVPEYKTKKNQFLMVSRLSDFQKNIKSALRIWRRFEQMGTNYELVLAGYGEDERELLDYADSLNLKHFKYIGKSEDPISLYKESKYFMLTSRYEGFGMTLVEAQQCGCVPFAFDTYSALHDIIEDGKDGFIIPAGKERKYAEKMLWAVHHEEELEKMSVKCFLKSQKFSVNTIGKQWLNLFNNELYEIYK